MTKFRTKVVGMNEQTEAAPEVASATRTQTEPVWQVLVLNDPVNLMSYVVKVFQKVFSFSVQRAERHMIEVHRDGQSILWIGERERAEMYVQELQQWQLTAKLERQNG